MTDRRLIEEWMPIAALSEESIRERRSMTALPPKGVSNARTVSTSGPAPRSSLAVRLPEILQTREDAADGLAPTEQVAAYHALREELEDLKTGAAISALDRMAQKVELAKMRAVPLKRGPARRREMSRRAARIGLNHLRQDDPVRALRWQRTAAELDAQSPWAGQLRGRIQGWFRQNLESSLAARRWAESRELIRRWLHVLPGDPAVSRALREYSQARKTNLSFLLRTRGPESALDALRQERRLYPGLPEWAEAMSEITTSVQEKFESARGRQSLSRTRAELARQTRLASDYHLESVWDLSGNQKKIYDLEAALYPKMFDRDFGQLRYSYFRSTLLLSPFSEKQDGVLSLGRLPMMDVHYLPRGPINWGAGMVMGDMLVQHEDISVSLLVLGATVLKRGRRWVGWFTVGMDVIDTDEQQNLDESLSGLMLQFGLEYALHRKWTVMGTARRGDSDFPYTQLYLGLNYYMNNHVGIGVGVSQVDMEAEKRGEKFSFVNVLLPVLTVMF